LPYPDQLFPVSALKWTLPVVHQYGITVNWEWVHDDHMDSFPQLKQDIRAYCSHYGAQFNSLRERTLLSKTTLDSERSVHSILREMSSNEPD